ncbi:hypothetical protein [Candidatus Sororendozoicomonas aggregata]|uniref:hypothetical protein n=1 Tax=Candidatus Sororendozoicomonas aggregata TaxID=3073239 RepID=UPI002ED3A377
MIIKTLSPTGLLALVVLCYGSVFPNHGTCGIKGDSQEFASLILKRYGQEGQRTVNSVLSALEALGSRPGIESEGLCLRWLPENKELEILNSSSIPMGDIRAAIDRYQYSGWRPALHKHEGENYTMTLSCITRPQRGSQSEDGSMLYRQFVERNKSADEQKSADKKNDLPVTALESLTDHSTREYGYQALGVSNPTSDKAPPVPCISKSRARPYNPPSGSYWTTSICNSAAANYFATYANIPHGANPEWVDIGNQKLITLDLSQSFIEPDEKLSPQCHLIDHNFDYLADFLKERPAIKYIVDIGCGTAGKSLIMQHYLNAQGCDITVVPVDIHNPYRDIDVDKTLPINLIPAQDIIGACGDSTLFTVLRPCSGSSVYTEQLNKEIVKNKKQYYITSLIKNNPGCFVFASGDDDHSRPQKYIPLELVYTKHFTATVRDRCRADLITMAQQINTGNGIIGQLNRVLEALPSQRESYLDAIAEKKQNLKYSIERHPESSWPVIIFRDYLDDLLSSHGLATYDEIMQEIEINDLLMTGWHVYRQDNPPL